MLSINRMWKTIIPENLNHENLMTNIATGHSMAFVHSSVTLPFERLLIEKTTHDGYLPFLNAMMTSKRSAIYEGFQATLIRHTLIWDLFFVSSHLSNRIFKIIDPNPAFPGLNYVFKSVLTSSFVVGVGYPLEFLRNRILMEPEILTQGTLKSFTTLFNRYKWKNLYSGVPVMLLHNFFQTLFIQALVDRINTK